MNSISDPATLQGWLPPLAIGCCFGLCAGTLLGRHLRGGSANVLTAPSLGPKPKKRPRRFIVRGTGKDGKEDDAGGRFAEISASARQVFCEDAVAWMENLPSCFPQGSCVITGIPDIQEISPDGKMGLPTWREWFLKVVELTLQKLPEGGYAIFIQTDVKVSEGNASRRGQSEGGYWEYVDKAHLVQLAAARLPDVRLLWHRIIGSGDKPGWNSTVAGYSHCLCFKRGPGAEPFSGPPFPEVSRKGLQTWTAGFGVQCVEQVCAYALERGCTTVVDPFCGEGAVLAVGNAMGMAAIGVELCAKRARAATQLDGNLLLANDRAERGAVVGKASA